MLLSAGVATPSRANYFTDLNAPIERNIGSAPNPTVYDLRGTYPAASRAMNEHGQVGLKLSLSEDGTVTDAVVQSSSGSLRLDDAAVKYVKSSWSYEPPTGQKMPTEMLFTVNFVLR